MAPQNHNKTKELFHQLNNYTAFSGLLNLWENDVPTPALYKKSCYVFIYILMNLSICVLILLEVSAFIKWDELSLKEISDLVVFALSHPILYWFSFSVVYHKSRVVALLRCLCVKLKHVYNDDIIEESMIKRTKFYIALYLSFCCVSLFFYGLDSLIQVICFGKTFTTLVAVWPDEEDRSTTAAIARILIYIAWWFVIFLSSNAYTMAIASTICLSYQFKTLRTYFHGFDTIFMKEDLTQHQKEVEYEKALKVGIKLHSNTLWCARQCQIVYNWVYSGQIIVSLTGLGMLMLQMAKSERSIVVTVAIIATASAILVTTGIFMWNAGDVTDEGSHVATAMYSSGWQYCEREASTRVRRLLSLAMTQAQQPVIIRGCAVMDLSHRTFLSIVKSSYSVFSVIY